MDTGKIYKIIDDAKKQNFVSQNSAFLELVKQMVIDERIGLAAEAIDIYTKQVHGTKDFIVASLPAIIINHYVIYKANVTTNVLFDWQQSNTDWAENIKKNATKPDALVLTVGNMLTSINSHHVA